MSSRPEFHIAYLDSTKNQILEVKGVDVAAQLEKLKSAIDYVLKNMEKIGKYELSELTAKVGVEAGYLVFKADGSIEMTWKKPT